MQQEGRYVVLMCFFLMTHLECRFTVGEFGACQMYFNALSVWIQPGGGGCAANPTNWSWFSGTSYGWADLALPKPELCQS